MGREQKARNIFEYCDEDGDDTLTKDELYTLIKKDKTVGRFLRIPTSDEDKFKKALKKFFKNADTNLDGVLSWGEFKTYVLQLRPRSEEGSSNEESSEDE